MPDESALEVLRALGFNDLEAEVYLFLLSSPAVTAYAAGKALGRPTANVYKAVESLARRGAALIEEGEQRVCRAVPIAELTKQLERAFKASLDQARAVLNNVETAHADERVYKVESVVSVFERCEEMLRRAERVAVIDAFPRSLARIAPWVKAACARGVEVYVEAYAPIEIKAAQIVQAPSPQAVLDMWRCEQLNVVVDGREHLLALLSSDLATVRQAVWSNSLYLSCLHHSGRLCENTLIAALNADRQGRADEALRVLRQHKFFLNSDVPGEQELLGRFTPAQLRPAEQKTRKRQSSRRT